MKLVRLIDLVPKRELGEVWIKVAVQEEGLSREGELIAKLTECADEKINQEASTEYGLQFLTGFCLLKVTDPSSPEYPFHVLGTLEEEHSPWKIYHMPYRTRDPVDLRLSPEKRD